MQGAAGRAMQPVAEIRLADRKTDEPVALVDRHRVAEQAVARRKTPGGDRSGARAGGRREDAPVVGKPRRSLPEFAEERRVTRRDKVRPQAVADDDDGAIHGGAPFCRQHILERHPGLSGKFADPCKSRKTGRIIDSALRFDPIILDKAA